LANELLFAITVLISVFAVSAGTYFMDTQGEKRQELRERIARREAFYRETLTELQDGLLEWERVLRVIHLRKLELQNKTQRWEPGVQFADPDSEKMLTIRRKVEIFSARTADEEIIGLICKAREEVDYALSSKSSDDAWGHLKKSEADQREASDRAGKQLLKYV
jgi:hypothetical protein